MNLPPEIKSAEAFASSLAFEEYDERLARIKQRDLAIWNAAIEKAAEVAANKLPSRTWKTTMQEISEAILNLKQKE